MNLDIQHFDALAGLVRKCAETGLTIYEYRYQERAWGSWRLIVGTIGERIYFSWDGKESYLGIGISQFADINDDPSWQPFGDNSIGGTSKTDEEIFQFVWQIVSEHWAP